MPSNFNTLLAWFLNHAIKRCWQDLKEASSKDTSWRWSKGFPDVSMWWKRQRSDHKSCYKSFPRSQGKRYLLQWQNCLTEQFILLYFIKRAITSLHNTFHSKESILHARKLILRYKALKISNEMLLYSFGRIVKALKMAPKEKVWHSRSERKMQRR